MLETENLEQRRQAIILKLRNRKEAAAAKGEKFDFNNLSGKLPWGLARWIAGSTGLLDKPLHERGQKYGGEVSELSFETTWKDFFAQIDMILERLEREKKINLAKLKEFQEIIDGTQSGKTTFEAGAIVNQKLQKGLEPLYIELRLLGFSHYDLWQ